MFEDEIQEDLKKMSIADVVEKYNLSFNELFKLTMKLNNKNKVKINDNTYICKTNSRKWAIRKSIDGHMYYYGTYKVKRDASLVVKELIKVDWNIEELPRILKELDIERCR